MEFLIDLVTGRYALDDLIRSGGYLILVAIVFTETGLLVAAYGAGTIVAMVAGSWHALTALVDTVRPTSFAPIESSVKAAMEGTGMLMVRRWRRWGGSAAKPSMWRVWLGVNIGLGLGVTTHLDQGAFQATNMPSDGAAHEDNYGMYTPFLMLNAEGKLPARLRLNFLHQDATPDLPSLRERIKQTFSIGAELAFLLHLHRHVLRLAPRGPGHRFSVMAGHAS